MSANKPLTVEVAIDSLKNTDEFKAVLEYFTHNRENLLEEFKRPEMLENPQALANLAGKIEQMDQMLVELGGPYYPDGKLKQS